MKPNSKEGLAPKRSVPKKPEAGAAPFVPSASVPITIYRELAAELQQAQAQLREMTEHKERLSQQNQQLRNEIEQMVKAVLHGRDVAHLLQLDASVSSSRTPGSAPAAPSAPPQPDGETDPSALAEELKDLTEAIAPRPLQSEAAPSAAPQTADSSPSLADSLLVKPSAIKMPSYPRPLSATQASATAPASVPNAQKQRSLKSWSLALIIFLVVVTAFGAGFTVTLYLQNRTTHQAN